MVLEGRLSKLVRTCQEQKLDHQYDAMAEYRLDLRDRGLDQFQVTHPLMRSMQVIGSHNKSLYGK